MADIDELARRTTAMVMSLARRAMGLATGVALVSLVIGGLSYLTGLAALDGSARSAWTLVGAVMLVVAVGAPLLARFRLSSISKDATELVLELGTLISGNADAQRVVIETVAVDQPDAAGAHHHAGDHRDPPVLPPQPGRLDDDGPAHAARRPAGRDDVPDPAGHLDRADAGLRRARVPVPRRLGALTGAAGDPGSRVPGDAHGASSADDGRLELQLGPVQRVGLRADRPLRARG